MSGLALLALWRPSQCRVVLRGFGVRVYEIGDVCLAT